MGDADYINRQLMEILAPKTDYMAVRGAQGKEQPAHHTPAGPVLLGCLLCDGCCNMHACMW